MSTYRWRLAEVAAASIPMVFAATVASAQLSFPGPPIAASGLTTAAVSASEARYHVDTKRRAVWASASLQPANLPIDSMNAIVASAASRWLGIATKSVIAGSQIDQAIPIAIAAGREDYARQLIAARTQSPGLSLQNKAYTYLMAIAAFSALDNHRQMAVAEEYLKKLDELGNIAAPWQFDARQVLVGAYYELGRTADVIRHGVKTLELLSIIPFVDREAMFYSDGGVNRTYLATVEALAGLPDGAARIRHIDTLLQKGTVPSASDLAFDGAMVQRRDQYEARAEEMLRLTARLGMKGSSIFADRWLNRPRQDSATVRIDDGRIRVIEIGYYSCWGCVHALYGLQRLREAFPETDIFMLTGTQGFWGNRLIDPDEEEERLTDFFLNKAKVKVPVAIQKKAKGENEDGGISLISHLLGPALPSYPFGGKPTIWILDGHGTVRRILTGFSRETEKQIGTTLQFLQREASMSSQSST